MVSAVAAEADEAAVVSAEAALVSAEAVEATEAYQWGHAVALAAQELHNAPDLPCGAQGVASPTGTCSAGPAAVAGRELDAASVSM